MSEYTFYIDEAGDEGIGTGGTAWFLIGGILVHKEEDRRVSQAVNRVKEQIGRGNKHHALHWRKLGRNHHKRLYAAQVFAEEPYRAIVCAMHKPSLRKTDQFKKKQYLYNYVTRHVIERLSWLVRDETAGQGKVDLLFEHRANLSYEDLASYIERHVKTDPEVADHVLGSIQPRSKGQSKNLQIADSFLGACFSALEPNQYSITDPSYIRLLAKRFYRRHGHLFSYGLKLLPYDFATDNQDGLEWLEDL